MSRLGIRAAAIALPARLPLAVALTLALALPATAQDSLSIDEDDLFGSEDDVVETVAEGAAGDSVRSLLVSSSTRIGGRFTGSAEAFFNYHDPWGGSLNLTQPNEYGLKPAVSALLFFDARPKEDSRFYGSVKTSWPFTTSQSVLTDATYRPVNPETGKPDVVPTSTTLALPNIKVFELFSDFSWNDSLYLRFGKQTVNWGVGYFFSPANVINLETIDVFNPTAQLEGPVALRAHLPLPGTQHNLWGYAVFDSATMKPEDTALAAKAEFALGAWELGAGAYYKREAPFRAMATASGSIGKLALFGEGVAQLGTDRTWVTQVSPTLAASKFVKTSETSDYDGTWFFKGSAGLMYSNSEAKISVIAQYLYDGEGYAKADKDARVTEARDGEDAIKALLGSNADSAFNLLMKGLIANSGRHYAALSFSRSKLLLDDLSFSLFAMGNLTDLSAFVKPTLSYRFFDGLSLSVSALFALGYDDGEYVVLYDGRAMGLSLALTMGSGSF